MITILNREENGRTIFEACDKGEVLGTLYSVLKPDTMVIEDIKSDIFLVDGLVRTAMNYAFNRFVNTCQIFCEDSAVREELLKRGFITFDDNSIPDIDKFFTEHKNCKKT